MVNRIQSEAQGTRLRLRRAAEGSQTSFRPLRAAIFLCLTIYKRVISPLLPSACRFHPTCSQYMREAVEIYGPMKGVWMGLKRLSRCHPFHEGGIDPVPR